MLMHEMETINPIEDNKDETDCWDDYFTKNISNPESINNYESLVLLVNFCLLDLDHLHESL